MRRPVLIISIAAVLALAAGIAALSLWPETRPPEPEDTDNGGHPGEPADLIRETQDNVSSVLFSPGGGIPYTLRRDPDSGDCELDAPEAVFPGRQSAMRTAYTYACSLTYLTRVTEEAGDEQLALFGLDKPVMTWRVNRADGTSAELMVGAEQAAGKGRYARRQNSREVFLLSELQSSYLTQTMEDFYDLSFFPYPASSEEEPTWPFIEGVLLEQNGGVIEMRKRSEEEMAEAALANSSQYVISRPVEGEGHEGMISTVLLAPITQIAPGRVEALLPADLSGYGLDDPARLTLTGPDGWSGTLLIGRHDAEQGGRYVMIEGYDAVLFDAKGDYRFLQTDYTQLRLATIWLYDIKEVSSLTFELEGVTRVLRFAHDYQDDDTHIIQGWLDDKELSETNARRLYMSALRIAQDGGTDAEIPAHPPAYRITMDFLDGGRDTVELHRIGDLQFLIVHNGAGTGLFISRMSLQQNFLSRFEILDRGEDIPRL